jgi:lipoate---protein ligase
MLCILSTNRDIFFNLAAEEYFLKNSMEEICMLWQSDDSVVVGKHQNAMAEVNYLWALKNNIPIARRLTGGGAVYHGSGNLNFTFIRNGEPGRLVDFNRFVFPIIKYLQSIGISAESGKRNDILVDDFKISGNAEHVFKTRVLHHGTLLFNANLNKLNESIKVKKDKFRDKAVQSVRSQVTNIYSLLKSGKNLKQFESELFKYLQSYYNFSECYEISPKELGAIETLRDNKYARNEWIYGYSPPYEFSNSILWQGNQVTISMNITKGYIKQITLESSAKKELWQKIEEQLLGCPYLLYDIQKRLRQIISNSEMISHLSELFF